MRVGVGPGMKMDCQRLVGKFAMARRSYRDVALKDRSRMDGREKVKNALSRMMVCK